MAVYMMPSMASISHVGFAQHNPGHLFLRKISCPGGDGQESFSKSKNEERVINHAVADALVGGGKEFEVCGLGSISKFSWVASSTGKGESRSEPGLRICCSLHLVEYDQLARSLIP